MEEEESGRGRRGCELLTRRLASAVTSLTVMSNRDDKEESEGEFRLQNEEERQGGNGEI